MIFADTPLRALRHGLVAGAVGTAAMTAYQTVRSMRKGSSLRETVAPEPPDRWSEAPAPGQVGYRVVHGVFERDVSPRRAPALTNAVHWLYGVGWGGLFGLVKASSGARAVPAGAVFGSVVFASGYAVLPLMHIYDPPWEYGVETLAVDWSYHLVYGVATAAAFAALERR
jgi:hypothetical protein